jgi:hypothetical protein
MKVAEKATASLLKTGFYNILGYTLFAALALKQRRQKTNILVN